MSRWDNRGKPDKGGQLMRTLIAIPCMDMVHTVFMRSMLTLNKVGEVQYRKLKLSSNVRITRKKDWDDKHLRRKR